MAHYFRNTAGNWSTVGNWSSTPFSSGYTAVAAIPTATDDVIFEAPSANCIVDAGLTRVCRTLTFTNYTNTIQMNAGITVSGSITLGAAMLITGSAGLTINVAGTVTITSIGGIQWGRPFTYNTVSGGTINITGDFYVSSWSNVGSNVTINGSTVYVTGDCSVFGQQSGTTPFVFTGTGTWSGTGYINGLTINSPGFTRTITGSVGVTTSFVRTAGTISAAGSTITFAGFTLNLGGQTIHNLTMNNAGVTPITVPTSVYLTGNLITPNGTTSWSGAGRVYVAGNLTNQGAFSGSVVVEMNGTGTINGTHYFPIEVNTATTTTIGTLCSLNTFTLTTGTLNLANTLDINGGTFTITTGFTAITGASNLTLSANTATITSNGVSWPTSVIMANTINTTTVITLSGPLTITGSFTSSSGAANSVSLNGSPLNVNGNLTVTKTFGGTTDITILGTGTSTWSGTGELGCNLNINKTGNFTVSSTVFFGNGKTLLYTNIGGVFTVAGSTLSVTNCTLSLGITVWNNLTIRASGNVATIYTVTITQNTAFTGNFVANGTTGAGSCAVNGLFNLTVGGNLTLGTVNGNLTGTSTIILNGTGTWSGGSTSALFSIDVTINSPLGVITAGNIYVGGGKRTLCTSNALAFTSTGLFYVNGNATLNAGSFVWQDLHIGLNSTLTLESSVTIRDLVIPSGLGGSTHVINGVGFIVTITRNLTHGNSALLSGTAKLIMTGSGTWSNSSTGAIGMDLELNSPGGTIVIGTNVIFGNTKILKYTNVGTLTTTGSTLSIPLGNAVTLDLQNIAWNNLSMAYNSTLTLSSASNFNNVTLGTAASGSTLLINGLFNFNIRGSLTNNQTIGGVTGTSTIRFTGTGNWGGSASILANPVIIDTTGAVTLTSNITWGLAGRAFTVTAGTLNMGATTLTVISGTTITVSATATLNGGSSTLSVSGTALTTFDTNSKNFFSITTPASAAISISSLLSATGTLTLNGATTFSGTAGWTCGNLVCPTVGTFNITLQEGITYTTTAGVSITGGTTGARPTMTSSGASNAIWTLNPGATLSMIYVNGIRIDSSQNSGQTIYSFGVLPADISTTINWYIGTRPGTVAYVFVN